MFKEEKTHKMLCLIKDVQNLWMIPWKEKTKVERILTVDGICPLIYPEAYPITLLPDEFFESKIVNSYDKELRFRLKQKIEIILIPLGDSYYCQPRQKLDSFEACISSDMEEFPEGDEYDKLRYDLLEEIKLKLLNTLTVNDIKSHSNKHIKGQS